MGAVPRTRKHSRPYPAQGDPRTPNPAPPVLPPWDRCFILYNQSKSARCRWPRFGARDARTGLYEIPGRIPVAIGLVDADRALQHIGRAQHGRRPVFPPIFNTGPERGLHRIHMPALVRRFLEDRRPLMPATYGHIVVGSRGTAFDQNVQLLRPEAGDFAFRIHFAQPVAWRHRPRTQLPEAVDERDINQDRRWQATPGQAVGQRRGEYPTCGGAFGQFAQCA